MSKPYPGGMLPGGVPAFNKANTDYVEQANTGKKPVSYGVFVGCDMEGTPCLYVRKGIRPKYVTEAELEEIAYKLSRYLNGGAA